MDMNTTQLVSKKAWAEPQITMIPKDDVQGGPTRTVETGGDIGPS